MPGVRLRISLYLEDAQNRNRIISGNPGDRPVIAGVFLYHAEPEWRGRIYARIRGLLYRFLNRFWSEYYSRFRQEILWLRPGGGCGQQRSAVEKMRGGVSDSGGFAYRRDFCDRSEG